MTYDRQPSLIQWDSAHFGIRIAGFGPQERADVPAAVEWAHAQRVRMLMTRCDTANVPVLHELERAGFLLMDTLVHYDFRFDRNEILQDTSQIPIRLFRHEDVLTIAEIARRSFQGYAGHFHNDPRLDRRKCDELYVEWASNSCHDRSLAEEVLVADSGNAVLGFITIKSSVPDTALIALNGVLPQARRRGLYRSLVVNALRWANDRDFQRMQVGTQVNNYAVQRIWQRLGFEIHASEHTYHLWLEE